MVQPSFPPYTRSHWWTDWFHKSDFNALDFQASQWGNVGDKLWRGHNEAISEVDWIQSTRFLGNGMERISSECLVLALSKEIESLSSYQRIAIERTMKSITPTLKQRLRDDLESIHTRLVEIYETFDLLNLEQLTLGARLLYEQSKRATLRSSSLRLTSS